MESFIRMHSLNLYLDLESEEEASDKKDAVEVDTSKKETTKESTTEVTSEEEAAKLIKKAVVGEAVGKDAVEEANAEEDDVADRVMDDSRKKEASKEAVKEAVKKDVVEKDAVSDAVMDYASMKNTSKKDAVDKVSVTKNTNEKEQESGSRDGWWHQLDKDVNDPHPRVALLGQGVWTLPGKKEAIYINPSKNICTFCPGRIKRTSYWQGSGREQYTEVRCTDFPWPSVSEHSSLAKGGPVLKHLGSLISNRLRQQFRKSIKYMQKKGAEGEGQEVEGVNQLPDPESSPPALPVLHMTPSKPTV